MFHKANDMVELSFLGEQTAKDDTINLVNTTACSMSMIIDKYDSIIDTGVVLKFLPYVLILLTGIVGLTLLIVFKKNIKRMKK